MTAIPSHNLMFLDSGAFSLYNKQTLPGTKKQKYQWFSTPEFRQYLDEYAAFIQKHKNGIDFYANVDVIYNPKLSWWSLKYLEEKHGLNPVPVIHQGTSLKWVHRYLDAGYTFLGLGGMAWRAEKLKCLDWLNSVFSILCNTPDRLPIVKTHGFAITSFSMLVRYPWYSVDSSTWQKAGSFGQIIVPKRDGGKFNYIRGPYRIAVSDISPHHKVKGQAITNISKAERQVIDQWIEFTGIPLGKTAADGTVIEVGLANNPYARHAANKIYFLELEKHLPAWPWPWRLTSRPSFGFKV